MRKRSALFNVAAVGSLGALGGLSAFGTACGSSSASGPASSWDGGASSDSSGVGPDGGPSPPSEAGVAYDGSSGADTGSAFDSGAADASVGPTRILAVHASANLFPFRLCFGGPTGTPIIPSLPYPSDPTQPMPETNIPGVPVGGAALLPPIELTGGVVTPYVVSTPRLLTDTTRSCEKLVCPGITPTGDCVATSEYVALPPIALPPGGTLVLAIQGCAPKAAAPMQTMSIAQCGSGYDPLIGNLTATVSPLTPWPGPSTGGLALQLAQLSPSSQDASLTYIDPPIDASVPLLAPALSGSPISVTVPRSEAGVTSAYFVLTQASGPPVTQSLDAIQFFQAPASNPTTYFNAPSAYFAAIIGDATDAAAPANLPDGAPNPAFDGHGLHVIAYPEIGN